MSGPSTISSVRTDQELRRVTMYDMYGRVMFFASSLTFSAFSICWEKWCSFDLWCAVTLLSKSSCGLWSKTGKRRQLVYRRGLMLKQPLFLWFFSIHSCFQREYSPIKWGYTWWNGENKDREHLGRSINNCRWKQKTTNTCFFLGSKSISFRITAASQTCWK